MLLLTTIIAGFLLAIGHTTVLPGVSLFVVVIGLALFVDITLAVTFALVAGIVLDLLDVHMLGLSSALTYILAAAVADVARHNVRAFADHLGRFYLVMTALTALLTPFTYGSPDGATPLAAVIVRVVIHLAIALVLLPFFQSIGERHKEELRERGIL